MKKIKLLQAHLLFHSRNISGSQVEHSAAVCVFKNILWPWGNEISSFGWSLVDADGVIMQITVNYSRIIRANLHPHRWSFSQGGSPSPSSSTELGSPGDWASEAVGGCGAQRDGGRRCAGLSGLEKQGSRVGASAEQGSSSMDPDSALTASPMWLSLLRLGWPWGACLLSSFKACSNSFLLRIRATFSVSV